MRSSAWRWSANEEGSTTPDTIEDPLAAARSLLEAPSPAVLTTYRKDGSAAVSPVWYRWAEGRFEVVIAKGDPKLHHLTQDPRCVLTVFETVRPFRGIEVRASPELVECDVTPIRAAIIGRYLGEGDGVRMAEQRRTRPGVLLLIAGDIRVWDLSASLPEDERDEG